MWPGFFLCPSSGEALLAESFALGLAAAGVLDLVIFVGRALI